MAKFRVELEQTEWQALLQLVNQGAMLANMAGMLIGKVSEQLQAGPVDPPKPKPNGAEPPEERASG